MTTTDVAALLLAVLANAAGVVVALWMWRRHRRRRRAMGSRHPSARPPVRVDLIDDGGSRAIRLGVPTGAPEVAIDIVGFRRREPTGAWDGEPLDEPLLLRPGTDVTLASRLPADVDALDVVVAWTALHDSGAVPGSRLFRLPPERDVPPFPARTAAGLSGRAVLVLVALLVAAGALAGLSIAGADGDDHDDGDAAVVAAPTVSAAPATSPPTTVAATTSTGPSSTTSTTTTSTTTTSTTTTTTSTTSTAPTSTTAPPADGPRVLAEGRVEPCRFGDDCLVVGFTIVGFDEPPSEYVCEFDDGSRFTFGFLGDGADVACSTISPTATITVEVGGVRSEPISRP